MGDDPGAWVFCFVDLAGFTALTEAHGDDDAVALLDRFAEIVASSLAPDDQFVKTIGDAAMIRFASGSGAVTETQHIFERCTAEPRFPVPRAGLHCGVAVERHGDWFGATVNLAARVASQARAGQVLATRAVADAARGIDVAVASLGEFALRNIVAPVELFELQVSPPAGGFSIDPVCRMQIAITDAAGRLRHRGTEHWFCSLKCAAAFAATPDRYVPGASN